MVKPARENRPANIGTLLLHAFQAHERLLFERFAEEGFGELRSKHGAVLANLDGAGTRPSVLAGRAGLSRSAMAELLDELEELGYVRRVDDLEDGRAKLVLLTDRGRKCVALAHGSLSALETRFAHAVGARRYASLRRALEEIVEHFRTGREVTQPRL